MPEILLPLTDVAKRLGGIHRNTLRGLIARGEIPITRIGGRVFVAESDLDAYIADAKTTAV